MENRTISVEQMRKSDAYTIANFVESRELMYRAAMGVYNSYGGWKGKKIAIVTGGGNNGGDGYALAGILKKDGIDSVIIKVSEKMSEDGKYYSDIANELGVRSEVFAPETDFSGYDVIVDCILGTGFSGEVRGNARTAIDAINRSGAYVISVDINSGMNGDALVAHHHAALLAVLMDLIGALSFADPVMTVEPARPPLMASNTS